MPGVPIRWNNAALTKSETNSSAARQAREPLDRLIDLQMIPPPNMDAFDAPMRDVVCTRRQRTDTPIQALVTMNDVQWVEAARGLAQRTLSECGSGADVGKRLGHMWRLALARPIEPSQREILERTFVRQMDKYAKDKGAA